MCRFIAALAVITIAAAPTASATAKPQATAKKQTPCYAWATVVIKQPTKMPGVDTSTIVSGMLTTRQEVLTYKASPSGCTNVPHAHHTRLIQSTTVPYSEANTGANSVRQVSVTIQVLALCNLHYNAGEPDCQ
jgi:hypothetical protein